MNVVMHTLESAPPEARASLELVKSRFGFIPNLTATMAQAPGLLHAYIEIWDAFSASALSPVEQQVVALTVSFRNGCRYCMSGHSMLASLAGIDGAALDALRRGGPLADRRLEALRAFTLAVIEAGGPVPESTVDAFLAAGFTREHVLAIPLGIAFKTLSNMTNRIQFVPVDEPLAGSRWEPGEPGMEVLVTGWVKESGRDALARYQAAAGPIMARHGGRPRLKSRPATAFVGSNPDVVVLMEFPSAGAARAAFEDADYVPLIPLRDEAFARLDVVTLNR